MGYLGLVGNLRRGMLQGFPKVPFLMGYLGLVGNEMFRLLACPSVGCPFLMGYLGLVGNAGRHN